MRLQCILGRLALVSLLVGTSVLAAAPVTISPAYAHCDGLDGPVVGA